MTIVIKRIKMSFYLLILVSFSAIFRDANSKQHSDTPATLPLE
jgi:hypothetical protein